MLLKKSFKSHSLTTLIGLDWYQGSEEYSSVQSLVLYYMQANCMPTKIYEYNGE